MARGQIQGRTIFSRSALLSQTIAGFRSTRLGTHVISSILYLGGCDDTLAWIRSNFMSGGNPDRAMRATHDNDADAAGEYEFDLVVIGGGSGGLACSKQAAEHGASVAVVDFVTPSKHGSTWGLGGTCVNVGCIPKKLMHNTALLGENLADARSFGWQLPETASHDWSTMVTGIQDHIRSLNFGYRVQLRQKGVTYKNALAKFVDPHTLELTDKKGKTSTLTARRVVIAVGGRPRELDIPGGELAINSDDIFSLSTAPGKTLVIGASYVALECAGFLTALGYDTTVMVRSILLRGFDREIADMIGEAMKHHGTKFAMQTSPTAIEKLDDGRLKVTSKGADGDEVEEVYDTVFCATGRVPITKALNLEAAGVTARVDGKIDAVNEQTNVPHIYAIGDVLYNRPELTPVAIAAGKLLASRLYNGATKAMDYESIATTVFTPLEYGAIGLSEEDAIAKYGEANVEVYHSKFTPLEWTVPEHRHEVQAFAKLVVNKADNNRVVGFHYAGPNAGEVTQGFSVAIKMGATYENFHSTIGIHPTVAEEFTTMDVTKSSGASADKGGC